MKKLLCFVLIFANQSVFNSETKKSYEIQEIQSAHSPICRIQKDNVVTYILDTDDSSQIISISDANNNYKAIKKKNIKYAITYYNTFEHAYFKQILDPFNILLNMFQHKKRVDKNFALELIRNTTLPIHQEENEDHIKFTLTSESIHFFADYIKCDDDYSAGLIDKNDKHNTEHELPYSKEYYEEFKNTYVKQQSRVEESLKINQEKRNNFIEFEFSMKDKKLSHEAKKEIESACQPIYRYENDEIVTYTLRTVHSQTFVLYNKKDDLYKAIKEEQLIFAKEIHTDLEKQYFKQYLDPLNVILNMCKKNRFEVELALNLIDNCSITINKKENDKQIIFYLVSKKIELIAGYDKVTDTYFTSSINPINKQRIEYYLPYPKGFFVLLKNRYEKQKSNSLKVNLSVNKENSIDIKFDFHTELID